MEFGSVSAAHGSVESGTMAGVGKCILVTGPPVSIAIAISFTVTEK